MKISLPHGSRKYKRKEIKDIDPDDTAPKLVTINNTETDALKEIIEEATKVIMNTGEALDQKNLEDNNDFTTVLYKRKNRSSPGAQSEAKKSWNKETSDDKMISDIYKKMGPSMYIENQ